MNKEQFLNLESKEAIRYALAKLRDKEWNPEQFAKAMDSWNKHQNVKMIQETLLT